MEMIAIADLYDPPLNPASFNFATKPGRACRNCLFQRQRVSVCNKAVELALLAGLANCDQEDVIYILREVDPRQMVIEEEE